MDAQWGLLWLAVKLHQGHLTGFWDIQNGLILSRQPSYCLWYVSCAWRSSWAYDTKQDRQYMCNVTLRHICATNIAVGNAISITNYCCESMASKYPACNVHAPYCHLWPAWLNINFPCYLINGTIKKSYWQKSVLWFSLQLLSETFLILRRLEQDMIKMYSGLHAKYSLF